MLSQRDLEDIAIVSGGLAFLWFALEVVRLCL